MPLTSKGHFQIGSSSAMTNAAEFLAKSIKPSFDSLASENSGRTDDGIMHITWIKNNLRKWEIEMPPCTSSEASAILSLVQGQKYYIKIWDIKTNSEVTVHVYTSNSSAECYSGVVMNGLYQGLSFSAIELGD